MSASWAEQLLGGPLPEEPNATCADCAMCPAPPADAAAGRKAVYFNPETKCCTYVPEILNHRAGAILADTDHRMGPGRDSVIARIRRQVAVTPLGLFKPGDYHLRYERHSSAFGRSKSMLCPHFDSNAAQCGIWPYRPPACLTYFCKHRRGAAGQRFWQALHRFLGALDMSLATRCAVEAGISAEALCELFPASGGQARPSVLSPDGDVDPASYARLWGNWLGHEAEFYLRCAGLAETVDFLTLLTAGGPELRVLAQIVLTRHQQLIEPRLPERLEAGPFRILDVHSGGCRVQSYSPYDPIDVPL
ncbi:MAG: hypothetical protein ACKV22_10665, partial [Bryobacteraceae bacterium]